MEEKLFCAPIGFAERTQEYPYILPLGFPDMVQLLKEPHSRIFLTKIVVVRP
jgi:hypothetical protein